MKTPPLRRLVVTALLLLSATPAFAQKGKPGGGGTTTPKPPVRYDINFFTVPYSGINIHDFNDLGMAVGTALKPGSVQIGWLYDPLLGQAAVDLNLIGAAGVPDGWHISSALGINNRGDVVGALANPALPDARKGYVLTVSRDPSVSSRLYELPDSAWGYAFGRKINNSGDVLGSFRRADGTYGHYLFHTGLYDDPPAPDAAPSELGLVTDGGACQLNGFGQVAGVLTGGTPFRYTPGLGTETFPTLASSGSGGSRTYVYGINDAGTLCGYGYLLKKGMDAVPFRVAAAPELLNEDPATTSATSINGAGDLVIDSRYLYRDDWKAVNGTGLIDIGSIVTGTTEELATWSAGSNRILAHVNERRPDTGYGDLVGHVAFADGTRYGVLLTPVPAP